MQVTYQNICKDFAEQTHLLIAGKTGSGKSVILNGIMKYLLACREDETRFILIDPKKVELYKYSKMFNVYRYADEPETIRSALDYAVAVMTSRFEKMRDTGKTMYTGTDLYVIVDEVADLMTTDKKYCKPLLQRIAQLGRAAKVHLILCTQRPTNNIIPIDITCNIDSRVALKCAKAQDSRNIIGEAGAELLPKYGECLYTSPDEDGIGHYIIRMESEEEIQELINMIPVKQAPSAKELKKAKKAKERAEDLSSITEFLYNLFLFKLFTK